MNYIKSILFLSLSLLLWTSCENDGFYYQDEARIRLEGPKIWALDTDSIEFSFLTYPAEFTEIQIDIEACIMGPVTDYDRTANLTVDKDRTTATSDLYTVPTSVVIPANTNKATFPVTLKRVALLQEKTVRLYVGVIPSEDFAVGNNERNHILFIWNDILSMPKNWDSLKEHFGEYSNVKYRFMLNNAGGVSSFDTETMSWSMLHNYNLIFTNALNEYNAAHPGQSLTDENGVLVTFPVK